MDLEQKAILRLREAARVSEEYYEAPLLLTDSGGKDSSVVKALAERGGGQVRSCPRPHNGGRAGDGYVCPVRVQTTGRKRREMYCQLPILQRPEGDYVEPYPSKKVPANEITTILLRGSQGNLR